jgi:hypothetical protein
MATSSRKFGRMRLAQFALLGSLATTTSLGLATDVQYGDVSAGSSADLGIHRAPYPFALPLGQTTSDVIGVAVASFKCPKLETQTWVFYRNGSFTRGPTHRPEATGTFRLPSGKTSADVLDMAAAGNVVYTWYKNGQVSAGRIATDDPECPPTRWFYPPKFISQVDLANERALYPYTSVLPREDIVGIGIHDATSKVYTYFRDGRYSIGTSDQLGKDGVYGYKLPGKQPSQLIGVGIDGRNSWVFGFYSK